MSQAVTIRNVLLALLGVAALVLKPLYHGPLEETVYAYGGNFAVSFALYFVAVTSAARRDFGRLAAVLAVLIAVEAFEATNGFGVMSNTYDPFDYVANAAGVGAAAVVDLAWSRAVRRTGTRADA